MVVLGQERPEALEFSGIFNPTTANMVLQSMGQYANALRDDYKEASEREEQFLKENNSFTSPITKDAQNYYDMTTGGLNRLFAYAQQQGIDLLRTPEGRGLIQQYIISRPYGDLANMRQSAETAKQYQEMQQKLKAAGKYSPELEQALGVGDMSQWDTTRDGQWTWNSPTEFKSLYDLTHDRFDPLAKLNFDLGPGYDEYHRKKGVDVAHMIPIAETELDGVKKSPYYQMYLNLYGDDEGIKDAIINANKGVLHDADEIDEFQMEKYKQGQANYRANLEERGRNARAAAKANKDAGGSTYSITTQNRIDTVKNLGFSSLKAYEDAINGYTNKYIKRYVKKYGKQPDAYTIAKIQSDARENIQKRVVSIYMKQGMSKSKAILKACSTKMDPDVLQNNMWGTDALYDGKDLNEGGWVTVSPQMQERLYTEAQVLQFFNPANKRRSSTYNRSKVAAKNTTQVKVATNDNIFTVYDPHRQIERKFVKLQSNTEDGNAKVMYYDATDDLDPRTAQGQHIDQRYNESVGLKSKSEVTTLNTDQEIELGE